MPPALMSDEMTPDPSFTGFCPSGSITEPGSSSAFVSSARSMEVFSLFMVQ